MDRQYGRILALATVVAPLALLALARYSPGYFTNTQYLAGLVFLEFLGVCLWFYDCLFFPLLMIVFLWAGTDFPLAGSWTAARWLVLGVGALFGLLRSLRLGWQHYKAFHLVSFFCVASALASAMVSALPSFSALKAVSLFLLFLYGSAGARLVLRNPDGFFRGLLLACEINVYVTMLFYFVLDFEFWGNPNAMGAVQGIVAAPLLLWGAVVATKKNLRMRRALAFAGAMYLIYFSVTRAAFLSVAVAILLLLIGIRWYKLLIQGAVATACLIAVIAIAAPDHFAELKTSFTEGVIYKGHEAQGLLGSRRTPWEETVAVIRDNPYLGSGFGASVKQEHAFGEAGKFSSTTDTNREHGSSYLAIAEWMGLVGILPFLALLILLILALRHVFVWMRSEGSAAHYSVPLMMVLAAGLVHAIFEDWLFAVGFHLTVLFWVFAFLLMDLVPHANEHAAMYVHGMRFRIWPTGQRAGTPVATFDGAGQFNSR